MALGLFSFTKQFSPSVLTYPNHSGVHEIFYGNSTIGFIDVNATIISDLDVIAAGKTTRIIANISFIKTKENYNTSIEYGFWYMGVDNTWIINIDEIILKPGEYQLIDKNVTFLTGGVYRHLLRGYNEPEISPEWIYGSNFSVAGRDTAVLMEHSYLQRASNERIIGLTYIVVAASLINIALVLWYKKN